ncbi:MAG: hypothetical protein KBC02_00040 [Candidatus Pacebacteria bacterium]|nr:hypothetical protein [Candidatus Paceibacterota bacterium]
MKLDTSHVSTTSQLRNIQRIPITFIPGLEYPYASGVRCALCSKPLSRLNPHIVCFSCILEVRSSQSQSLIEAAQHILHIRRLPAHLTDARELRRMNHRIAQATRRWHRLRDRPRSNEVLR